MRQIFLDTAQAGRCTAERRTRKRAGPDRYQRGLVTGVELNDTES